MPELPDCPRWERLVECLSRRQGRRLVADNSCLCLPPGVKRWHVLRSLVGEKVLEAQIAASPQRFRGIRHRAAWAQCPNVIAKLGGIQMVFNGYGWHERERPPTSDELLAAKRDRYNYTIDQIGPDRCMFESNFPVDKLSSSYTVLWN